MHPPSLLQSQHRSLCSIIVESQGDVEMDVCVARPGPDSLMLRGIGRTGPDITKEALNAPRQLWTIYGHREHMLAHGLTGLVCSYKSRTI